MRTLLLTLAVVTGCAAPPAAGPQPTSALAGDRIDAAGSLATARATHSATLLADGTVLIAGGYDGACGIAETELFDPALDKTVPGPRLTVPRCSHSATTLPDGRVLIAGGQGPPVSGVSEALATTEVYDPAVDSFRKSNDMSDARTNHTAVKLPDRTVMIVGGAGGPSGDTSLATAEVFNPSDGSWTAAGALSGSRSGHVAVAFPDGRVLVAGGDQVTRGNRRALATAEIFTLEKREWRSAGTMNCPRSEASAALAGDGSVIVAAGDFAAPGQAADPKGCADRYRP